MRPTTSVSQDARTGLLASIPALVPANLDRQVISFYSYRGGVGRSMALANVANWLADRVAGRGPTDIPAAASGIEGATLADYPDPALVRGTSRGILCIDFDLESPELDALLPPESPYDGRGLMGLLADLKPLLAKPDQLRERLSGVLGRAKAESTYCYRVQHHRELYVLPAVGPRLSESDREDAKRLLVESLKEVKVDEAKNIGNARFYEALREALRNHFSYTLVDARTGLADAAFATTALLPDALVLVVPPKLSHLAPVQRVLAEFLDEHGLQASDPAVPVIPVLSPRPAYSDPRLEVFRDVSARFLFRWLDPAQREAAGVHRSVPTMRPVSLRPRLIELPFDAHLQVGDRLLIGPGNSDEPKDTEAPLYRAYVRLARSIQQGNALNDPEGALSLERDLLRDGRIAEALGCLLASLAARPDLPSGWNAILRRYREHLAYDAQSRQSVVTFCRSALETFDHIPVTRLHANLMLSELLSTDSRSESISHLKQAWTTALDSHEGRLLRPALMAISRAYRRRPDDVLPDLPGLSDVVEATSALALDAPPFRDNLLGVLLALESAYERVPKTQHLLISALQDQYQLFDRDEHRATVVSDLSKARLTTLDFPQALQLAKTSAHLRGAESRMVINYVDLGCRLSQYEDVRQFIMTSAGKEIADELEMLVAFRDRSSPDHSIARARQYFSSKEAPSLQSYVCGMIYLNCADFRRAAVALKEAAADQFAGDLDVKTLIGLSEWVYANFDSTLPESSANRFTSSTPLGPEPLAEPTLLLALVHEPDAVIERAVQELQTAEEWPGVWPLAQFSWQLLAIGQPGAVDRGEDALLNEVLRAKPGLSAFVQSHETFPLLCAVASRVAPRHAGVSRIARALRMLDRLAKESVASLPGSSKEDAIEPANGIEGDVVSEIHLRWKRRLQDVEARSPLADVISLIRASTRGRHHTIEFEAIPRNTASDESQAFRSAFGRSFPSLTPLL